MLIINHLKPFVTKFGPVRILPGTNVIPADIETAIRGNPGLMASMNENIKCGLWEEIKANESKPTPKLSSAVTPAVNSAPGTPVADPVEQIKKMTAADATKVVQKMFDVVTLRKIQESDKRKGVQEVVKKQLEAISSIEPAE